MTTPSAREPVRDVYRMFEVPIAVRCSPGSFLDRMRSTYARFRVEPSVEPSATLEISDGLDRDGTLVLDNGEERFHLHFVGDYGQFSCENNRTLQLEDLGFGDPDRVVETALAATVARTRPGCDLYRAAAVAIDGEAVLLLGAGGLGKTTLALELLRRGGAFLADGIGCIDRTTATVAPFPAGIRLPDNRRIADIEELYPGRISGPAPLRTILFLRGVADRARLEPLSRTRALLALRGYRFVPARDAASRLFASIDFVARARCFDLVLGEPSESADLVLESACPVEVREEA